MSVPLMQVRLRADYGRLCVLIVVRFDLRAV